ncbi:MAG: PAS domain S-box protein [Bacteroidota bacterium]
MTNQDYDCTQPEPSLQELMVAYTSLKESFACELADRKRAESELRQQKQISQLVLEYSSDILVFLDKDGYQRYISPSAETITGYSLEELKKSFTEVIHPDDVERVKLVFNDLLIHPERILKGEYRHLHKQGGFRYFEAIGRNYLNDPNLEGLVVNIRDITERKLAEVALIQSEEKYRTIYENIQDVFYQVDMNGMIVDISPSVRYFSEFNRDEIIGTPAENLYGNLFDRKIFLETIAQKGEVRDYELMIKSKNGTVKHVSVNAKIIRDANGNHHHTDGLIRDITDRRLAEQVLNETLSELKKSQEIAQLGNWKAEFGSELFTGSEECCRIFGFPANYQAGFKEVLDCVHPDDRERMRGEFRNLMETGVQFKTEFRINRAVTGEARTILTVGEIQYDSQGTPYAMFGTNQDITERKLAQEELHLKSLVMDQIKDRVTITDLNGKITYVNQAQIEIPGYSREELLESDFDIFGDDANHQVTQQEIYRQTLQQGFWRGEVTNFTRSGKKSLLDVRTQVVKNSKGEPIALSGIATDISKQKMLENELIKAKEKAEESDRLKSSFLANMSHEIRTPMNGILGFAQLLKEPKLTGEEQQEYINIIVKSGNRMLNIINDIIDISKIEAGQMDVSISETNINKQIDFVYAFFRPEAEQKGLRFVTLKSLQENEARINTDREKFYAILSNLVKNAIKYSISGSIEFGYIKKGDFLEFFVKDTGIGIEKEKQDAIFERFIQADIENKHAYEGAGLGLSIARAYVELLGGKIRVESEPGKGSVFYFTLSYPPPSAGDLDSTEGSFATGTSSPGKLLKILIAEDDATSDMFLTKLVSKISHEVINVKTGIKAVEACRNNADIDLVLMDIRMPHMNGYEAARQIRQFNKDVVIIAQTAYGLAGDREKSLEAGCNDYISKPIDSVLFLNKIKGYFI